MEMAWPEDRRPENRRPNIGATERWTSAAVGAGLALAGLARRDRAGFAAAVTGGALVLRGATGYCPVNAAVGRNTGSDETRVALAGNRGVHVKTSVTIARPLPELYAFWRRLENLPDFLQHLRSVQQTSAERSHWIAAGPAGLQVEWDAEIINEVENQVIGWRSLPGSRIVSAGSVNFDDAGRDRGTRITVHLRYDPPGGRLGAAVARMFGAEPSRQIREDLRRLKQLLETGEVAVEQGNRGIGNRRIG